MSKFRLTVHTLGILLAGLGAIFADSDKVTTQNSVKDQNIPGGVDVIGEGSDFVIQGDFPEFPTELPEVTKALENRFVPPPQVFIPPRVPTNEVP